MKVRYNTKSYSLNGSAPSGKKDGDLRYTVSSFIYHGQTVPFAYSDKSRDALLYKDWEFKAFKKIVLPFDLRDCAHYAFKNFCGDGDTDFLCITFSELQIYLYNGALCYSDNIEEIFSTDSHFVTMQSNESKKFNFIIANDGPKPSALYLSSQDMRAYNKTIRHIPTGINKVIAGDFNGDGVGDFAIISTCSHPIVVINFINQKEGLVYTQDVFLLNNPSHIEMRHLFFGDFNGDGKMDILHYPVHQSRDNTLDITKGQSLDIKPTYYFSKGDGSFSLYLASNIFLDPIYSDGKSIVGRFDEDQVDQVLMLTSNTLHFLRRYQEGNIPSVDFVEVWSNDFDNLNAFSYDIDSDGIDELILYTGHSVNIFTFELCPPPGLRYLANIHKIKYDDLLFKIGASYKKVESANYRSSPLESKIPKIIHYVWLTDLYYPKRFTKQGGEFVVHNFNLLNEEDPGAWSINIWTNNVEFLQYISPLPEVINVIDIQDIRTCHSLSKVVQSFIQEKEFVSAADLVRLCVLKDIGGLYIDLDYIIYGDIIKIHEIFEFYAIIEEGKMDWINNGLIASTKNHPIINAAIELYQPLGSLVIDNCGYKKSSKVCIETGPGLLSIAYYLASKDYTDIAIPPSIASNRFNSGPYNHITSSSMKISVDGTVENVSCFCYQTFESTWLDNSKLAAADISNVVRVCQFANELLELRMELCRDIEEYTRATAPYDLEELAYGFIATRLIAITGDLDEGVHTQQF